MNNIINNTCVVDGKTISFKSDYKPSLSQIVSFVDSVVNSVMIDDNYQSVLKDTMFKMNIVIYFSDIDYKEYFTDIDAIDDFVNGTDVVDTIIANMDIEAVESLYNGVEDAIEYKTGIHKSGFDVALSSLVKNLNNKLSTVDIDSIGKLATMLSNINGDMTADKILNTYIQSDVFKSHLESAEKNKQHRDGLADKSIKNILDMYDNDKVADVVDDKNNVSTKQKNKID